jgi:hypothetical protein
VGDQPFRVTGGPKKVTCRPPQRGMGRWCVGLSAILSGDVNRGVFVYDIYNFKTGKSRVLGVAARTAGKRNGSPIMFNRCPYCGEPILFATEKEKDG